ncbi:MAG TPA: hypothetical protein VGD08_00310 [Stellaceae bacterium]
MNDRGSNLAIESFARKLAAHVAAAMAQAGVTYKFEVPPHDAFDKLVSVTGEWLENYVDLATIPHDVECEANCVPETGPA